MIYLVSQLTLYDLNLMLPNIPIVYSVFDRFDLLQLNKASDLQFTSACFQYFAIGIDSID